MSDLVSEEAIEVAALAQRSPSHKPGPPDTDLVAIWKRTARITLEAAAPLILAAELERLVRDHGHEFASTGPRTEQPTVRGLSASVVRVCRVAWPRDGLHENDRL